MKNEVCHSKEFKIEAVRLLQEGSKSISELAMELGVKRTVIYRWKDQLEKEGENALGRKLGRPRKEDQSEVSKLRQELKEVKEERDILKKAAAYFARDLR